MPTTNQGASYEIINGQYVSAGKAKSLLNLPARICSEKPESNQRNQIEDRRMEQGKAGVRYRVVFVVLRRRLLDSHDNARFALKPLCDIVALALGFDDDSDEKITFEYHQCKTKGMTGTHILITETTGTTAKSSPQALEARQ